MIIEIVGIILMVFGLMGKAYKYVFKSEVSPIVGGTTHYGLGLFVSHLQPFWAGLISALYIMYEYFDWAVNRDTVYKDIAEYTAGIVSGLGASMFGL